MCASGQTGCSGYDVYLSSSGDKGATWSTPLKVSEGISQTAVFPNIVAGAPGQVAVSWYGTNVLGDMNAVPDSTSWDVYVTQITGAASSSPTLTTDDVQSGFHHGPICTQGTACTGTTRNLLDFFDMKFDRNGDLGVVYTRDHGDGLTEIAYAYQTSGCTLTSADCGPGANVPEFPIQSLPAVVGALALGSVIFLRRRAGRRT
jgi:hypothetical protein